MFDSLEFEDIDSDKFETGMAMRGELDHSQTQQLAYFVSINVASLLLDFDSKKSYDHPSIQAFLNYVWKATSHNHPCPVSLRPALIQAMKERTQGGTLGALGGSGHVGGNLGALPNAPAVVLPGAKKASEPKLKKKPSLKKAAQQKIQACSSRLTELKCWTTKLNESAL